MVTSYDSTKETYMKMKERNGIKSNKLLSIAAYLFISFQEELISPCDRNKERNLISLLTSHELIFFMMLLKLSPFKYFFLTGSSST